MKLIELIELLQEEHRITPHANVEIRPPSPSALEHKMEALEMDYPECTPVECINNHHTVTIITE